MPQWKIIVIFLIDRRTRALSAGDLPLYSMYDVQQRLEIKGKCHRLSDTLSQIITSHEISLELKTYI